MGWKVRLASIFLPIKKSGIYSFCKGITTCDSWSWIKWFCNVSIRGYYHTFAEWVFKCFLVTPENDFIKTLCNTEWKHTKMYLTRLRWLEFAHEKLCSCLKMIARFLIFEFRRICFTPFDEVYVAKMEYCSYHAEYSILQVKNSSWCFEFRKWLLPMHFSVNALMWRHTPARPGWFLQHPWHFWSPSTPLHHPH